MVLKVLHLSGRSHISQEERNLSKSVLTPPTRSKSSDVFYRDQICITTFCIISNFSLTHLQIVEDNQSF